MKIIRILSLVFTLICFLHLIFILVFYIWTTIAIKILFYICFIFLSLCYIYIILLDLSFKNNFLKKFIKKLLHFYTFLFFFLFYYIFVLMEIVALGINISKFLEYWKNCPFTLTDSYEKLHHKRRCELYNINNNSRYQYQYICSYDPTEDFKYEIIKNYRGDTRKKEKQLKQEIEPEYMFCIPAKSAIKDNAIISLFNNKYLNNNNYYCSRTNKPEKYSYAKDKDCNNKNQRNWFYVLFYFSFFQIFYILVVTYYLVEILKNIRRYGNVDFGIRNYNFNNISLKSTKISEINEGNSNFIRTITKNIIYENNNEIPIEINIKKFDLDNKNRISNSLNDKQTNLDVISEEVTIKYSILNRK